MHNDDDADADAAAGGDTSSTGSSSQQQTTELLSPAAVEEFASGSQLHQIYVESVDSKKLLFLFYTGLKKDGSPSIDLDESPWSLLKKRDIKPNHQDYANEVQRRHEAAPRKDERTPRPKNWNLEASIKWLGL